MTLEQKYQQQYEIGFPIFKKLFSLNKKEFINVMKDIFQDNKSVMEILENYPKIIKILENDEPESIKIHFYSNIEVTYFGIKYKPEHGQSQIILKFDKFFNVDAALSSTQQKN